MQVNTKNLISIDENRTAVIMEIEQLISDDEIVDTIVKRILNEHIHAFAELAKNK